MSIPCEKLELEAHLLNSALDFAEETANLPPTDHDGVPEISIRENDSFENALIELVKLSIERAEHCKGSSGDPATMWVEFARKALKDCGVINPRFKRFENIKLFSESSEDMQRELYEEATGSND
jgi:hypothetical protein